MHFTMQTGMSMERMRKKYNRVKVRLLDRFNRSEIPVSAYLGAGLDVRPPVQEKFGGFEVASLSSH